MLSKKRCPRIDRPANRVGNTAIERERFAVELWEEAINLTVILFKSSDLYVRFLYLLVIYIYMYYVLVVRVCLAFFD